MNIKQKQGKRIDSDESLVNDILELHPEYRDKHGLSKIILKEIIGTLMRVITKRLIEGGSVTLPGVGKIVVVNSGTTTYYNPHTKAKEDVAPKKRVAFRVSSIIKRRLAKGKS